jgi:hypothetical protein
MADGSGNSNLGVWIVAGGAAIALLLMLGGTGPKRQALQQRNIPAVPKPLPVAPAARTTDGPAVSGYHPETDQPLEKPEGKYAGSDSCRKCHEHKFNSWHTSYHRTMTQKPGPESVIGDFEDAVFKNHSTGYSFRMSREAEDYFITVEPPPGVDRSRHPNPVHTEYRKWPVALLTGSHTMQGYWVPDGPGKTIALAPLMYLKEDERWISRSSAFLEPPGRRHIFETGSWNRNCIRCHNSGPHSDVLPGGGYDSKVAEFGISCESCHGPATHHVNWRRAEADPKREPQGEDQIVNPVDLSHERSSQVCGACHGRAWSKNDGAYVPYLPGDDLGEDNAFLSYEPEVVALLDKYLTKHQLPDGVTTGKQLVDTFLWSDGMARVSSSEYNGLIKSPCYERGKLSCFSCHSLHQAKNDSRPGKEWATDQLGKGMHGNQACLQCHEKGEYATVRHTRHTVDSAGSECYNCHMPHTSYGLMKAIRSHVVSSPSVGATLATGRPNACNLCHLDKSLGWTSGYLADWYGSAKPELDADQENLSAAVLDALKGDASLRALTAWSMGWKPAQTASGSEWMVPYLALMMEDSYEAVRYIAGRSLKRQNRYRELPYDFLGAQKERKEMLELLMEDWMAGRLKDYSGGALANLLMDDKGLIDGPEFARCLSERDTRLIGLNE